MVPPHLKRICCLWEVGSINLAAGMKRTKEHQQTKYNKNTEILKTNNSNLYLFMLISYPTMPKCGTRPFQCGSQASLSYLRHAQGLQKCLWPVSITPKKCRLMCQAEAGEGFGEWPTEVQRNVGLSHAARALGFTGAHAIQAWPTNKTRPHLWTVKYCRPNHVRSYLLCVSRWKESLIYNYRKQLSVTVLGAYRCLLVKKNKLFTRIFCLSFGEASFLCFLACNRWISSFLPSVLYLLSLSLSLSLSLFSKIL